MFFLDEQQIRSKCSRVGLGHRADDIANVASHCVQFYNLSSTISVKTGFARFGGAPDISKGFIWPMRGAVPLSFIAQINLADIAQHINEPSLPKNGILYFFLYWEEEDWLSLSTQFGSEQGSLVYFSDSNEQLMPSDAQETFESAIPEMQSALMIPSTLSLATERFAFTKKEDELYSDMFEEDDPRAFTPSHSFLGYPLQIQNDLGHDAEFDLRKKLLGDESVNWDDEKVLSGATEWRLLLQVDSNEECEMSWGDSGILYYMIKHSDLIENRWDRVVALMQFT